MAKASKIITPAGISTTEDEDIRDDESSDEVVAPSDEVVDNTGKPNLTVESVRAHVLTKFVDDAKLKAEKAGVDFDEDAARAAGVTFADKRVREIFPDVS